MQIKLGKLVKKRYLMASYALRSLLLLLLLLLDDLRLHLHILIHVLILLFRKGNEALLCHLHLHIVRLVVLHLVNLLFWDHRDRRGCCHVLLLLLMLDLISKLGDHHFALSTVI